MSKEFTEKIPITVYGSDSKGEMFVEDTATAVVARDWILVAIRKRIPSGSEVIVFNKTNGNQAEFLVEEQDSNGLYRARLKDQTVDVWEKDFGGAPQPAVDTRPRLHLVCKSCGTQESVQMDPAEVTRADAGEVFWRHCAQCVEETDWQSASWLAEQWRVASQKREEPRGAAAAAPPPPDGAPEVIFTPPPPPPVPEEVAAPPINWAEKRGSRRIQMKTRARVRRTNNSSEIVAPLNVSRGGIAFESRQEYALDEMIQVAMHYREGEQPLETLGSIVRVTPNASAKEYGVKFG